MPLSTITQDVVFFKSHAVVSSNPEVQGMLRSFTTAHGKPSGDAGAEDLGNHLRGQIPQ